FALARDRPRGPFRCLLAEAGSFDDVRSSAAIAQSERDGDVRHRTGDPLNEQEVSEELGLETRVHEEDFTGSREAREGKRDAARKSIPKTPSSFSSALPSFVFSLLSKSPLTSRLPSPTLAA